MEEVRCSNCSTVMTDGSKFWRCPNCHQIYDPSQQMSFRVVELDLSGDKPKLKEIKHEN